MCIRDREIVVDASGALIRLTDKESGQPLLRPGQRMCDWRLYKNVHPGYDAWELDRGWETRCMDCLLYTSRCG